MSKATPKTAECLESWEAQSLRRIAQALGEAEDTFLVGDSVENDLHGICEIVSIWQNLKQSTDRQELLIRARMIAARSNESDIIEDTQTQDNRS